MSARLKLKHMDHRIAMLEAENDRLRYELSRLSVKWEVIGVHETLDNMALSVVPKEYLTSVTSHLSRALISKMCENLEEYIARHLPDSIYLCGNILDIRLLVPKFNESLVEVTLR